jgi:hypothetical protein
MLLYVFYDRLVNLVAIWYNLWPFGIVCDHLVHFPYFGIFGPRKIWQSWLPASLYMSHLVSNTLNFFNRNSERDAFSIPSF